MAQLFNYCNWSKKDTHPVEDGNGKKECPERDSNSRPLDHSNFTFDHMYGCISVERLVPLVKIAGVWGDGRDQRANQLRHRDTLR